MFWEIARELFANFTRVLVGVHLTGVVVDSIIHHENLTRAMFHGNKKRS
jgi:cytochrome b